jgi:hypothetical protein
LLIVSSISGTSSAFYVNQQANGFKPNTHILTGNTAIDSILAGSDTVTIGNRIYPVDPRIADAIRSFPDYYRGGVVGPDGFPDIYVGQSLIHPDTRCDNGLKPNDQCNSSPGHSFTHQWLRHVYDSAWDSYNRYYDPATGDHFYTLSSNAEGATGYIAEGVTGYIYANEQPNTSPLYRYYFILSRDDESKKALAFGYGYLTHAAGDMWAHTLVNSYAQGIFPGAAEISEDRAKLAWATRHIIVEGYLGEHTPDTNLAVNSPSDFIYRTLIDSSFVDSRGQDAKSLGRGEIFNYFFDLRVRLVQKSVDLQNEADELQRRADACRPLDFSCSRIGLLVEREVVEQMKAYVDEWIKDVDSGLRAWPQMSQNVAYNLFTLNNFDGASEVIDDFIGDHLASMLGAPDFVGAAYNRIDNITDFVVGLREEVVQPIRDFKYYIILQTTGLNIPALKEFYSNPANYINSPGSVTIEGQRIDLGLPIDTSQKLDRFMGIENGVNNPNIKFNPEIFAAVKNTITLGKLLLLSPETLNQLLRDHGAVPIYQGKDNGYGQENAMLDFARSIDANHQWRVNSIREGDVRPDGTLRQHGEGMPLWLACSARDRVFRVLFVDWENGNFPDLGEGCLKEKRITVRFINATVTDADSPSRVISSPFPVLSFRLNDQSIAYPESRDVQIPLGTQIQLPNNFEITTIEYDKFAVSATFRDISLYNSRVPFPPPFPSHTPFSRQIANEYNAGDNFGQGMHTYIASGTGWQLIQSGSPPFSSARYMPHRMSFEITYQIDVSDIESAEPTIQEDCVGFNTDRTSIQNIEGTWKVVDGSHWILDFGSNQQNAQKALDLIKHYRFLSQCFVGRPIAEMTYFLTSEGAPTGSFAQQDCITFNPQTTTVQQIQGTWKVVDGSHWILDFGSNEEDARKALQIIKKYTFSQICFVGRPATAVSDIMMYFIQ